MRHFLLLWMTTLLAGCISFSSSETAQAPDYLAFCQGKEAQCRDICSNTGIQVFSCKATPSTGLEFQCQCKNPGAPI